MSTGAIVMMVIGCVGLWGGCAAAVIFAIRYGKKHPESEDQEENQDENKDTKNE
ncbi:MAG: methionine/alanine import family NSS transporter small subunit [Anaerovoracaceae bacterium]